MSQALIEQKEELLRKYLFKWAQSEGLAVHPEQISVKIKIRAQVFTENLTEEDWQKLLQSHFEWEKREVDFLNYLKENSNRCNSEIAYERYFPRVTGNPYFYFNRMQNRLRSLSREYILSDSSERIDFKWINYIFIRKRLVPVR